MEILSPSTSGGGRIIKVYYHIVCSHCTVLLKVLVGHVKRHRVLPEAICEQPLVSAVVVHDHDLAVGLESVVLKCALVFEPVHAATPHDLAVL